MSLEGYSEEFLNQMQSDYELYTREEPAGFKRSSDVRKQLHKAEDVKKVAAQVISKLGNFVYQWELCGGFRRGNTMVHDGDLVVWLRYDPSPDTMLSFQHKLTEILKDQSQQGNIKFMDEELRKEEPEEGKEKKKRKRKSKRAAKPKECKLYRFWYNHIPLEINIAKTEQQFEVLKFIRTGTAEFHRNLLIEAQNMGMTIRFSHDDSLDMDLFGLYGAVRSWVTDKKGRRKSSWIINPARLEAWRERDIIEKVLGEYVEPADRETYFS